MKVSFGMYSNKEDTEPLQRIIRDAALDAGMSESQVTIVMTCFLENLAVEVAKGNAVSIPGFGLFGPARWESKKYPEEGWAVPRFYASRGFRNEVRNCCTPFPIAERKLRNYRKNHHMSRKPTPDDSRVGSTVFSAMEKIRQDIRRQMRDCGQDG